MFARVFGRRVGGVAAAVVTAVAVVSGSLAVPAAAESSTPVVSVDGVLGSAEVQPAADSGVTAPRESQPGEVPAADGELVSRRTTHSRTYAQPDGSYRSVLGALPINFTDSGGQLAPIDTTLVPAGQQAAGSAAPAQGAAFVTRAGAAVLSVPGRGDGPVRVQASGSSWVQTRLLGATGSPAVKGSTATVAEALPGVAVGWTSTLGGVKETLTLASPQAASDFTFALSTAPGLSPVLTGTGAVEVRDQAGAVVWMLPAPFMDDAAGAHSDAVRYALAEQSEGGWRLAMTADRGWLDDPSRRFPVVVDPTILLSAGGSGASQDLACEIRSSTASTGYCAAADVAVGAVSGSVSRTVARFPQLNQVVSANAVIAFSELEMPVTGISGSSSLTVQARPLTGSFTSGATWNTRDGVNSWTGGAGALGQSSTTVVSKTLASSPVGTTLVLQVSELTRRWLTGQTANYGLLLRSTDESVLTRASFAGLTSTCTTSSCGTRLQVSHVERLGKYNANEFFDNQLTDTSQLSVNLATGNAVLTADDLGVERTWNSKRTEAVGQIGRGWDWGAGRDSLAYVQASDGAIRYYAPGDAMYMFTKNADGSYKSPPGLTATATNNGGGHIDLFFARSKTTRTFGPGFGQLVSSKDRNGNTTHYAYDKTLTPKDGLPVTTTITDPAGRVLTASNDGTYLTQISDAASRTTKYGYVATTAAADLLGSVTDAAGGVTKYDYDGFGRIKRITTPAGRVVRLAYDSKNRVLSLTRVLDPAGDGGLGSGPTTTFDYTPITADPNSPNPISSTARGTTVVTDPRGNATTYRHDFAARVERVTDALGRHRDADYGPDNNITAAYDAMGTATSNGKATTYTFDAMFNPTKTTQPTGASSTATYANSAHPHLPDTSTDEQGNKTAYSYDGPGNLTKTQDTTGGSTTGKTVSYGVFGNTGVAACGGRTGQTGQVCTATDGNGNTTKYSYDSQGNLASVTPPAPLGVTRYSYDAIGRVASVTDGKGQTNRFRYDGMGRTTQVLYAGTTSCASSTCISYGYDADGNQSSQTDGAGTISYRYDLLGRQTGKTLPGQTEQVLTYDSAGNLTSIKDPGGTTSYRYDTVNQLIDLAEPGGSCTASPTVRCTTFGYNNNGVRTRTTYPTSPSTVLTLTPDDSGRVKQIKAVTGTAVQSDFSYTYANAVGTDTALTQTRRDGVNGRTTGYGYDTLTQLKTAKETDSAGTQTAAWSYGYDKAGNRTSATIGSTTNSFGYNAANQIISRNGSTSGFAHDANGNQTAAVGATTRTAAVNAKDQFTSHTVGTKSYASSYLGAGQQERTVFGATSFASSPTGLVRANNNGAIADYVRDPSGTLIAMRYGGASYYFLFDGLGSTVALVNAAGSKVNSYSYDPYGRSRAKTENVPNNHEYIGGHFDSPTGLYKLGIRYYDPTLGRFTQPDPTGQDPHYTYASNNPTSFTDLSGASFLGDVLEVGGQILGFAGSALPGGPGVILGGIGTVLSVGGAYINRGPAAARYALYVNLAATAAGLAGPAARALAYSAVSAALSSETAAY